MRNKLWQHVIVVITILNSFCDAGDIKQCPEYQIHFEKILGFRPPYLPSSYGAPLDENILFKSFHHIPSVINLQCMELCKNDHNCESYVLNFNKSECYGFTSNARQHGARSLRLLDDHQTVEEDITVVYFIKTCLNSKFYNFCENEIPTTNH